MKILKKVFSLFMGVGKEKDLTEDFADIKSLISALVLMFFLFVVVIALIVLLLTN